MAFQVPDSLSLPLAVDASRRTFACLLEVCERLVGDFFRDEKQVRGRFAAVPELGLPWSVGSACFIHSC